MKKYIDGIIAGFIATIVISILMWLASYINLTPQFSVIKEITDIFAPGNTFVGWLIHFILGSVIWGILFAVVVDSMVVRMHDWQAGILFALAIWLIMMFLYMPMMGHGLFGYQLGFLPALITLIVHIIFGAILGYTYGILEKHR